MTRRDWTPAFRRYQSRTVAASAAYAVLLFGTVWLFRFHSPPSGPLAWALAVLPALPLVGIFAALGLYLREEGDEYQRLLVVRQIVVGTGLTLSVATIWGFLESFGQAPRVDAYWVAIVWFFFFGVGRYVRGRL